MTIVDCTLLAEVDMISAGVVGLIALIVFVFAILSAKNWHWVNVVFLILTLITSITAIIGMTLAFQHRYEGMVEFRDQERAVEKAEAQVAEIIGGDPLSLKYDKGSLRYNNNQLALAMIGRGRSWSGLKVTVDGEQRKFELQSERGLAGEAIMYAFADSRGFPDRYIGSVSVAPELDGEGKAIPKRYTLEPVALVDTGRFDEPRSAWTLYEKMPQDRRGIFKDQLKASVGRKSDSAEQESPEDQQRKTFVERMNDESKEFDIATFVQILKRDFLQAGRLGYDPDSVEYEQMIDQYAFDGQSVEKIADYAKNAPGRKNTKFDPTPQETFVKFAFTIDSEIAVKTDGIGILADVGMFNDAGETVIGKLMQNPDGVSFKANDVILIDEPSSVEFARTHAGKVKQLDKIYVRQLQDFPMMFKSRKLRVAKLEDEIITSQATSAKAQIALKDARGQIEVREALLTEGTEDKDGFAKDSESLNQTTDAFKERSAELAREIEQRKARIDSLYQQIKDQSLAKLRDAVSVSN